MVVISILCAVFVSIANTAGLSTMLPIMRVLVKGDTIGAWADREIAQRRLGLKFSDETKDLIIVKIEAGQPPLARLECHEQDVVVAPPDNSHASMPALLARTCPTRSRSSKVLQIRDGGGCERSASASVASTVAGRRIAMALSNSSGQGDCDWRSASSRRWRFLPTSAKFFQEYLSDKAAVLTVNDIRRRLYDRVLHIPLSHFNLSGTSDVTSRLTQDAQGLAEGFKTVLGQSIQEPIKAAMAFGAGIVHELEADDVHRPLRAVIAGHHQEVRQEDAPGEQEGHDQFIEHARPDRRIAGWHSSGERRQCRTIRAAAISAHHGQARG